MKRVLVPGLALVSLLVVACGERSLPRPPEAADVRRPVEEWLREESIRLLRDYVKIDTTNETRGEIDGAAFLKEFFDCAGIQNEIVCPAPRRCNLLARLPGKRRQGALLLLNHIDVVSAYPAFWTEAPPFEGVIKNGFLYGRGVYDMKALAIAQALAMRGLKERGIVPESDVLFLAEADEEVGQRWGSRWLLEHRPEWFEGVANVLNEGGSNEMVLRTVRYWGIETIQAGYALAELEADTSGPLEALASRFAKVPGPVAEPHPHVVLGFNMLAEHLTHPLTDPMRHLDRVRKNPAELAILPDRYGAFLEARIHWVGPYPYPPEKPTGSRAFAVISIPPGLDPKPYLKPIVDALPPGVRLIRTGFGGPAGASPYPDAADGGLEARDRGVFAGHAVRTDAHLRGIHDLDPVSPAGVSDVRLLPDRHEHHGLGPPPRQRRAHLPARLLARLRHVRRQPGGIGPPPTGRRSVSRSHPN